MSKYLIDRIDDPPAIEVLYHSAVEAVEGSDRLERVVVRDATAGMRALEAAALFALIGAEPHPVDTGRRRARQRRFIFTGAELGNTPPRRPLWEGMERGPLPAEDQPARVFAAGDVRSGSVKHVASAAGEGSIAAHLASEHLRSRSTAIPGSPRRSQGVSVLTAGGW